MLDLRRAVTRPRQPVVVAVARTALRAQRLHVEGRLVLHVELEPFGRLARIADRPRGAVDLFQNRFGLGLIELGLTVRLPDLVVLDELLAEPEFLGKLIHERLVGLRFEQRRDHALAPLQRAIRCRDRTRRLELRAGW